MTTTPKPASRSRYTGIPYRTDATMTTARDEIATAWAEIDRQRQSLVNTSARLRSREARLFALLARVRAERDAPEPVASVIPEPAPIELTRLRRTVQALLASEDESAPFLVNGVLRCVVKITEQAETALRRATREGRDVA